MLSNRSHCSKLRPLEFIHARPQGLFALALGWPHTRAISLIDKNSARAPSAYLLFIIITGGGYHGSASLLPSLFTTMIGIGIIRIIGIFLDYRVLKYLMYVVQRISSSTSISTMY